MLGLDVRKFDAVAAIDEICEESLLEVDITEFVFMICGHVKDFTMKHSVRHMHLTRDSDEDKASNEDKPEDANFGLEKIPEKCLFPLSLLQKHQPCEELQQKHLNIKDKFLDIIQSYFKVIPSRPDYFFFNPADEEMEEPSLKLENEDSQEEDGLESVVNFGDDYVDGELDRTDNMCEDDGSAKSCLNTASSLSSIEKDTDHISLQDKNVHPPLFVHFSCSVRSSKQQMKSCPLNESSLPTCLNDIINCLDSESNEVNLDDLRITLDITCLSVPDDIESPEVSRNRVYTTSFSSSSPVPEAEYYRRQHINDEENESSCSDIATDTIQVNSLQNLPSFQREAVHKCIGKINWLLQDEKASVALNSFPITSEILDMVINHVKSSDDKPCCIIKEIPLMFVYGPETSLDKFIQAFKRMSPVGYRLNEVNGTYYLVLDAESARKLNHPFGSLDPPLGIVDKYQIIKSNPHSDDCTELKRIGEEIKDTPVFAGKEFSYHPDGESLNDDFKSSNLNNDTVFSFLREKGFHKVQQDEDSETEDGNDTQRPKNKFNRKTSMKRFSSSVKKRTISSTSLIDFERKYSLGERPHTAPPKVSLLDSNQYEEISDWDASA
ncbi:Protein SZT2, partial [Stegodyphus mimosarum]